jgi:8-oxo-dGTP diphosphatase
VDFFSIAGTFQRPAKNLFFSYEVLMMSAPQVGVGVLIVHNNRLLLLKRRAVHGEGTWSTAGGHLEFGESPEACAIREAEEETSLKITNVRFLGLTNDVFVESSKHYITIWMQGDVESGEARVNAPYEASEIGWFDWETLPTPLFLPLQQLLAGQCYPTTLTVR